MADWGAESGHIEVSVSGAVAVVTLRRPDQLNALTSAMHPAPPAFADGRDGSDLRACGTMVP
jgi:enoyl-CoA hydratase/carnithine racemase